MLLVAIKDIGLRSSKSLLRRLHTALPDNIRYPIDVAAKNIQDTLQNWHMPAYCVRSFLPDDKGGGTVLYLGDKPQYTTWTHKLFGRAIEPVLLGQFSLFQILSGRNQAFAADIVLCPLNALTLPLYKQYGWRILPVSVTCHINLDRPVKKIITSKGAKDDLRIARRLGYHFQLIKSEEAIQEFFHHMLIPTVKMRHEQRAFFSQWEHIKRVYQSGFLIGAYLKDQWIGAILLAPEETNTIRIANIGWRNGDNQWLKKGIATALYNQAFVWAQENEFRHVNLGSSNPFANDGPLNFKLKLGANIAMPNLKAERNQAQSADSFIGLKINLKSPAAQSFLTSTPLLEYTKDKLAVIGWNTEIPPLFRRQLDLGCEWVNLAETHDI